MKRKGKGGKNGIYGNDEENAGMKFRNRNGKDDRKQESKINKNDEGEINHRRIKGAMLYILRPIFTEGACMKFNGRSSDERQ